MVGRVGRGPWAHCPSGTFLTAYKQKGQDKSGAKIDDTALHAIRFRCGTPHKYRDEEMVSAEYHDHHNSAWYGEYHFCGKGYLISGVYGAWEKPNDGDGDDTSLNAVGLQCRSPHNGSVYGVNQAAKFRWDNYNYNVGCAHPHYVCAIRTRVEAHYNGDNTALNGFAVQCCTLTRGALAAYDDDEMDGDGDMLEKPY